MQPIILQGSTLGLGVIRSLGIMNIKSILFYNYKLEIARVSKYVSKAYKCPVWTDYEGLKKLLLDKKDNLGSGILIPTGDLQIEFLAKYKNELIKHYIVPVPDSKTVKLFLDKKETYKIAKTAGIAFPLTYYPESIEEALKIVRDMKFPLLIKPRKRDDFLYVFHQKLFIVNNKSELKDKLSLCFENKIKIMITEIIPGSDTQLYEYNFYVDKNGEILAGLGHVKLRQAPSSFGVGSVIKTIANDKVEELAKKFLKHIPDFYGPGQLEFKLDPRDNRYKLIEMNGRLSLQNELYAKAGINFSYLYYQEWVNNKAIKINHYIEDFYWIFLYRDLVNYIIKSKGKDLSFTSFIQPYLKKHIYGVESLSDPKPMILHWLQNVKNLSKFIKKNY